MNSPDFNPANAANSVETADRPSPGLAARSLLRKFWGYDDFRAGQAEIVETLRLGRDALIVMPTGGGKSICFQVPALLQSGLTIVLSPLVALMENQVQELRDRKIPAALLHSQQDRSQRRKILQAVEQQRLKLLYLSPETLLSPTVWQLLASPDLPISSLVLDEAHCLSQWGDSFRPTYFRLGAVRSALLKDKPVGSRIAIAAFTATADPTAQATITNILRLENPQLFKQNPFRSNLQIQIQRVWSPHDRRQQLLKLIQRQKNAIGQTSPGLVYVRSRQDSEDLASWLRQKGYRTQAYHAGLSAPERRQIEQDWISDRLQFVVSTNAFGMGVNKPNVRWVAHYHLPLLLSEYVQEIGRAGRDGQSAQVISLASESTGWLDPADRNRWQFFQRQSQQQRDRARQLLKKLPPTADIRQLKSDPDAEIALALLQQQGQLTWEDPFHFRLLSQAAPPPRSSGADPLDIRIYLRSRACRWRSILTGFGFLEEAQGLTCGQCDRCQRR